MTVALEKQGRVASAFLRHGVAVTVVDPAPVYDTEGSTTEAGAVLYTAQAIGPVDEARRWIAEGTASSVVATFYLPGGVDKPAPQWRLLVGTRTFTIAAVTTSTYLGLDLVYRLDCGEVAT
jgi:hypothetical protein